MSSDIVEKLRLLVPSDPSRASIDAITEIKRLNEYIKRQAMDILLCKEGNDMLHKENTRLRAALREIIADSFSVYAIQVARAALEEK